MGGDSITFSNPSLLVVGGAVILLVVLGVTSQTRRRRQLADHLGGPRAALRVAGSGLYGRRGRRILALGLATLLVAVAAAEPVWLAEERTHLLESPKSVVIALDVSASMQAADVPPTRLARAVQIAGELVDRAHGSRVGVLLFAGKGYVLVPPTYDLEAVAFLLEGVTGTLASAQDPGSLLATGIRDGLIQLPGEGERVIVLISDGEAGEPESDVIDAVREAAAQGVALHSVGVGTYGGGPVPSLGRPTRPSRSSAEGRQEDVSRLQELLLRRIADAGGGEYVRAGERSEMDHVVRAIQSRATPEEASSAVAGGALGSVLVVGSLLLLILDSLAEEWRRGRRLSRREA
jgi:Ca-activated chloride channel family protein